MEIIPVDMIRENLQNLPELVEPQGFSFRLFKRGDEDLWIDLTAACGLYQNLEDARKGFEGEFASRLDEMEQRCYFLVDNSNGKAVATTIAWPDPNYNGQDYGRIHWVGVHPDYRGRKLGRAIVLKAMHRLAEFHDRATLNTQTFRLPAIKLYLSLGFVPDINKEGSQEIWKIVMQDIQGFADKIN